MPEKSEELDSYTCACCGRTFRRAWSDADARAETVAMFGEVPESECSIVCDYCWAAMGFARRS